MVSALFQLKWLLWKNLIIVKRRFIATAFELLLPIYAPVIMLVIRLLVDSYQVGIHEFGECSEICRFPKNFSSLHSLAYYPDTNFTRKIMLKTVADPNMAQINQVKGGFRSENDLVDFLMALEAVNGTQPNTWNYAAGIVFETLPKAGSQYETIRYKIRMPATPRSESSGMFIPFASNNDWATGYIFPYPMSSGTRNNGSRCSASPNYQQEGFTAIMCAIDSAILNDFGIDTDNLTMTAQRNPYPAYFYDTNSLILQTTLASMLLIGFLPIVINAAVDVTSEREDKLKETLKMMGVSSSVQWSAWIIRYLVSAIISCIIQTVLYSIPIGERAVLANSDPTLIFIYVMLSCFASVAFGLMVASFFSSATTATVVVALLYMMSLAPYQFLQLQYVDLSVATRIAMMLISTVGMGFGSLVIADFETLGSGAQWSNLYVAPGAGDELTLNAVFLMLILDIFIYCIVAVYVENVKPGDFGVAQPWYFPFMKSYWFPNSSSNVPRHVSIDPDNLPGSLATVPEYAEKSWFEPSENYARSMGSPAVKIRGLTRRFNSDKTAVDNLCLDMFEGHITCLLGHNGSGKTTSMFMLTGFLAPTAGTAFINGQDITKASEMTQIRQQLGLCPQHDVLFRQLTVYEHLKLFAMLKGCPAAKIEQEVASALRSVNLEQKGNEYARNMSGGQKRRLSVAIAIIGGSKVLILDEPTSGLDPDARRSLWNVIQSTRQGRAILLTTHFLEEADALADRIAVLSSGRLQCAGSPMFLKKSLGGGYRLKIEVASNCNRPSLVDFVKHHVPSASLWAQTLRNEVMFTLPIGASEDVESSGKIAKLMDELERQDRSLGVESLSLSASSIEDVFVTAGIAKEFDENKGQMARPHSDSVEAGCEDVKFAPEQGFRSGLQLCLHQFYALSVKQAILIYRRPLISFIQLLIPAFFTAFAILIVKTIPGVSQLPPLLLTPNQFKTPIATVYTETNSSTKDAFSFSQSYSETMRKQYPQTNLIQVDDKRYGRLDDYLLQQGAKSYPDYRINYDLGASFGESINFTNAKAYFNGEAYHAVAVSLAAAFNAILNTNRSASFLLETINHPLPPTAMEQTQGSLVDGVNGFMIAMDMMFGLSVFMGCCVMQPVAERVSGAKRIQLIAGASPFIYWSALFLGQLIWLIPSACLIVALFAVADIEAYYIDGHWLHILVVLILFFVSTAPQNYLISMIFSTATRALVWMLLFNLMSAMVIMMLIYTFAIPGLGLEDIAYVMKIAFAFAFPQFAAGQAFQDYYTNYAQLKVCNIPDVKEMCEAAVKYNLTAVVFPCCPAPFCPDEQCWNPQENFLSYEGTGIGFFLLAMGVSALTYMTSLMLLEYGFYQRYFRWTYNTCIKPFTGSNSGSVRLREEDSDVAKERVDVESANSSSTGLIVRNATKRYRKDLTAVDSISFQVPSGTCFGLLGFNGAGKTSLYRMITGDNWVSSGDILVAGFSVNSEHNVAQQKLGYCPQSIELMDGLLDMLTGRQQLELIARLRGIRGNVDKYIQQLLNFLYLSKFADRQSKTYSGGMRRKLSTAVALIGQPAVVLLDEPTTGMDPAARRQFWKVVDQLKRCGAAVVLTSHSMDECDLLCDRIAVMTKGKLACIGTPTYLKSRFGGGMVLIAKAPNAAGLQPMINYIQQNVPCVTLKDSHLGTATFAIKNSNPIDPANSWSAMVTVLEKARIPELGVLEDYSLSHASLEQVFLSFASSSN